LLKDDQSEVIADVIEWEASEYVHHEKGVGWTMVLVVVALLLVAGAVYFGQYIFAVALALMAVVFGFYALRKPKTLHYKLTTQDLTIGEKVYPLSNFRAFGVVAEGAFHSIRLIPIKRLGLMTVMYVSDAEGEGVVDLLGSQLPMEHMEPDPLEELMTKLRF